MANNRFGEEVEEYLSVKNKPTRLVYSSAFELFKEFYESKHGVGKSFSSYLDRIFEELKKPRREQRRIAEIELVDFINYLKQKGKSNNTIRAYFAAVQNFLKFKGVMVSASFISNLPPALEKRINRKHEWTIEQIKTFIDLAPSYREKAIIAGLFQSGLGINELVNLNYGDIQEEYEKRIVPICLRLVRQKTNVPFKTFFGADTINYLRLYFETRKNLTPETPLFTTAGSNTKRLTTGAIQQRFSEIASDLPFLKEKDMAGYNPCRPHSLRAAFKSQLTNIISDDLIEFWMGHALGGVKDAYLNMPTEKLRELYMDAEKHLAIERTSRALKEKIELSPDTENKIMKRVEEITQQLFEKWIQDSETGKKLLETWRRQQEDADREAREELPKAREEFIKRQRREAKPKHREEQSRQASREPSFHELIYPRNSLEDKRSEI